MSALALVLLALAVAVLAASRAPLFMLIGVLAILCFGLFGDGFGQSIQVFPAVIGNLTKANVVLAIPFFVVSGAIMSEGSIAQRIIAFARALLGARTGGLAAATVGGCVFFAAISGSSPVTVIAIGSIMYPALCKDGYDERFSLGLVTTAGSLGILIPPSIPMIVYAIAASGQGPLDVGELFLAGVLPGLLIAVLLGAYARRVARRRGLAKERFDLGEVWRAFKDGFWALMLPVLILGGIYGGVFTPTEAAALSVAYALVVELLIHRELSPRDLPKILADSAVLLGVLLIVMSMAFALNHFFVDQQIADRVVEKILTMELSVFGFLLLMNLFLLLVGAMMDSISAILILAPLLAPIGVGLGIDPVHLGVIFIVNLEIGYLTPPIGINLFVASTVFEKPVGEVARSVAPFIGLMFVALGVITYVPSVSLGPVNVLLRDQPFYEALPRTPTTPEAATPQTAGSPDDEFELAPPQGGSLSPAQAKEIADALEREQDPGPSRTVEEGGTEPEFAGGKVLSVQEMMQIAEAREADGTGESDETGAD